MRLEFASCLALALTIVTTPAFAREPNAESRIRCLDQAASRIVAQAQTRSPSVRLLLDRIQQSDLIVFVRTDPLLLKHRAETRFVASVPGLRFVVVGINPGAYDVELVPMFGHELQHVVEIADSPEVRDDGGMATLFRRIGWPSVGNGFETSAAIDVGYQVAREIRGRHSSPQ